MSSCFSDIEVIELSTNEDNDLTGERLVFIQGKGRVYYRYLLNELDRWSLAGFDYLDEVTTTSYYQNVRRHTLRDAEPRVVALVLEFFLE